MGAVVVGPNHGAFKDLKKYDFMRTFGDFEDIPRMMEGIWMKMVKKRNGTGYYLVK